MAGLALALASERGALAPWLARPGADAPYSAGWRVLIGEAADGTRYTVVLPRRTQALYFVRGGALVETSTLHPGDTIEVAGVIHGDEIQAGQITIR